MNRTSKPAAGHSSYGISDLLHETFDFSEGSTGSILNRMLKAARVHLGMEVAFISQFEDNKRVFRYVDDESSLNLIKVGASDPLDESYCKRVVDGRLPELIQNAQELAEACALPVTRELGVGAHISTPIRLSDGSVFGTFCCFSFRADRSLNARDLDLIHVFAEIAGELVEKDVKAARLDGEKRQRISRLLDDDNFSMVWQPIMGIASGAIAGVEALARFPREPHLDPSGWFSEAASVGLGNSLEIRAMEKGLAALDELPEDCYVACNASAQALIEGRGTDMLRAYPLKRVVLEITEHDVVNDYPALLEALAPLRNNGIRIAVDDAGAGYASFRHIIQLKPDVIKLDMSLTRDIDRDIPRRSLALSMVQFSREIGSKLVAEGVETREELNTLADLGVELAQGYFLHRPKSMEELRQLLIKL